MSTIGGLNMGNLTDYLYVFTNGSVKINWYSITSGSIGNVAIDGLQAIEQTSGTVPYAGIIYTNDSTLSNWNNIITQNSSQASAVVTQTTRIATLKSDLVNVIKQINLLPATPGYESVSISSLDGLNTQNGIKETFVINITSGFSFSTNINITGDAGDVYILRWDADANPSNGYQGTVNPTNGATIIPHGGLTPSNFIHVAGDINAGTTGPIPAAPYPQGPRYANGQGALITGGSDFGIGVFYTGYWLTTGAPATYDSASGLYYGATTSSTNGIFVGGWYTISTSITRSDRNGAVYISPNPQTLPSADIWIKQYVSPNNGVAWIDATTAPGPYIAYNIQPKFKYVVTNPGNVTLTDITLVDNVYGAISLPTTTLNPTQSLEAINTVTWQAGQRTNIATATGYYNGTATTNSHTANYYGINSSIKILKYVSIDDGTTWLDASIPPGSQIDASITAQFKYVVTNTGNTNLVNFVITDSKLKLVGTIESLSPNASHEFILKYIKI